MERLRMRPDQQRAVGRPVCQECGGHLTHTWLLSPVGYLIFARGFSHSGAARLRSRPTCRTKYRGLGDHPR